MEEYHSFTKISALLSLFLTTQARAECNVELPYEQLIDCIVAEGYGSGCNAAAEEDIIETAVSTQ